MNTRCPNCGSVAISSRIVTKREVDLVDPLDYSKEEISKRISLEMQLYPYPATSNEILQIVIYCKGCGYTEVYTRSDL